MKIQENFQMAAEHHAAGRLPEAETFYRQVLTQNPNHAEALNSLGALYSQAGQNEAAVECLRRAIALNPLSVMYNCNAGLILARLGRTDESIVCYRRALALEPTHAPTLNNLGLALTIKGQLDEARDAFTKALVSKPDFAEAFYGLGQVELTRNNAAGAIEPLKRAVTIRPNFSEAWSDLGESLRGTNQLDDSILAYKQAINVQPNIAVYYFRLGNALQQRGFIDEAIGAFQQAIARAPKDASFQNNLGYAYYLKGLWDEAMQCFNRAIAIQPNFAMGFNNLGNILKDVGRMDEAMKCYQRALEIAPRDSFHHDNWVYALNFHPSFTAPAILKENRHWNEIHGAPLKQFIAVHDNDKSPDRRLRIGYVSPDLRDHVVGKNLLPLLEHHNHQAFEIFCYSQVPYPDSITKRFKASADQWRDILMVGDARAAEMIRTDKIDILVDLALHMAGNRLPLFARKPAPVQITFGGYPGGTGLDTIDYRLTDPLLDPPGEMDANYVEKSFRLPETFWCYDAAVMGSDQIPVSELPARQNGFVTFGCLNHFSKINDQVLNLWGKTLKAVPDSRMLLLMPPGEVRQRVLGNWQQQGIDPSRILIVDRQSPAEYFKLYHRIDIGLDTFPYNGHSTSLDSLWMGVPVITLVGNTAVGRAGLSQLSNLRLAKLAAYAPEEFVDIAAKLAADIPALTDLRAGLRAKMQQSPLTDAPAFARNIESAYRQIWRDWCRGGSPR